MSFLSWHYSQGINYYLSRWWNFLTELFFYFNPILLFKSLFAPWKRLVAEDHQPGFNFTRFWENLIFDLISRGIGAVVRLFLVVVGFISLVLTFILGLLGFLVWLLVPFLGLSVYRKIQSEPKNFLNRLFTGRPSFEKIWQNQAGQFVLARTGLGIEEVLTGSRIDEKVLAGLAPQSFKELIEKLLALKAWPDEFWREHQINPNALILAAAWWDRRQKRKSKLGKISLPPTGPALELLFGYTPNLDRFSVDLTSPVSFAEHLIGRQNTVSRMARAILAGESVFLTGQPGVGKWTVILEFVHRSKNGELDHRLTSSRILEVDFNSILAESPDLNTKKAKLSAVINEASSAGNVILVVRDFHRLVNPEVEGYDFTDVFEEKLKEGNLHLIAVSASADYERFLATNTRLKPYFEKIEVLPPTKEEAELILLDAAENWERKKPVLIRTSALLKILEDSDRFITETPFPEKALELLDAVIFYKEEKGKIGKEIIITEGDVDAVLAEKTGIPLASLTENEAEKLANLETLIHERLINQEVAVSFLARSLRVKRLGVINENRPLGAFLFLGPTGVGKTETAKVLARIYYGSEEAILRFDMAEFAGQEGLERLIGSVVQNQPGLLTTAIKNKPASLLLLDELEKATPQILNLFLTLLDEGYLNDAFNQRVNGNNLFIIGTSNIAADYVWRLVESGVKGEELQKKVTDYILGQGLFPPEFLNRFDGVVVYEPLSKDNLTKIAELMFADLAQELLKKDIVLSVSPETVEKLVNDSYNPAFGARPMRRLVNLGIGDILSQAILKGEIKSGDKIQLLPGGKPAEFIWKKWENGSSQDKTPNNNGR